MIIRKAEEKDTDDVLRLLSQVLELHAAIRPDIFVPGTTKYSREELAVIFADENRPVYVAADGEDRVLGYAFCVLREPPRHVNMVPFRTLYIDDLCVDETARGKHMGSALFEHVKKEAARLGCYEVTLNVWEGNDSALAFYRKKGMRPKEYQMEYILDQSE
ncbi:MAG: GNAT family N-acetyltransferase [Oscillospiraceae bacterium]|nr:GNAT family N-acetyltransferase [Oscillospiraceae bacterium]